jgi:hypothetical protein
MERHSGFAGSVCASSHCVLSARHRNLSPRNVPGLALYMTSLTQLRALMSTSPYFARVQKRPQNSSVLPALTSHGNLLAGATTRIAIGFILNPLTIVKARFEVGSWYKFVHKFEGLITPEQYL